MIDVLSTTSPDMILAAGEHIQYIAQSGDTVTIGGGEGQFTGLNVRFSDGVEKIVRVISIALAVAWALFLIWNLGKPGGSRQAVQKMGGVVGIIAALTAIVGGLNINATMGLLDSALQVGWAVIQTITEAFGRGNGNG